MEFLLMKDDMMYQKKQDETKYKTGHKCLLFLCFSNHKGSSVYNASKIQNLKQTQTENFNFSYQPSF